MDYSYDPYREYVERRITRREFERLVAQRNGDDPLAWGLFQALWRLPAWYFTSLRQDWNAVVGEFRQIYGQG